MRTIILQLQRGVDVEAPVMLICCTSTSMSKKTKGQTFRANYAKHIHPYLFRGGVHFLKTMVSSFILIYSGGCSFPEDNSIL